MVPVLTGGGYLYTLHAFVLGTNACIARLAMDTPKKQLEELLGPTPTHPWAALIPQVLLWSFRRYCVQKLILSEGSLEESLCEDILELVHMYCAKGLEVVSIDWFTPENIEQVSSPLENYMRFFTAFCKELDRTIEEDDYKTQDALSDFLDESIGAMISAWLGTKFARFLIFPLDAEDDDEFTEAHFSRLINSLLAYSHAAPTPVPTVAEPPPVEEPIPEPEPEPEPRKRPSLLWYFLSNPLSIPAPPPEETYVPPAPSELQVPQEPAPTVATAIAARRRTLCKTGRRSKEARVKTKKTHPASY